MTDSNIEVEIVGEYVIIKNNDKKSVLDSDDVLHLINEINENEDKVNRLMKEFSELKAMMGAK